MQFTTSVVVMAAALLSTTSLAVPVAEAAPGPVTRISLYNGTLSRREAGYAQIWNKCQGFTIYYSEVVENGVRSTGMVGPSSRKTLYFPTMTKDGVSVKMCKGAPNCANPFQFEYTWDQAAARTYYDMSAVNGDPFVGYSRYVYPSDGSGATYSCPPGVDSSSCEFTAPTNGPVGNADDGTVIVCQICKDGG